MSVSPEDIARIARLAALDVDAASLPVLVRQIGGILDYVSRLEAVPGGARMPGISHPPALRRDEVLPADLAAPPASFAPAFRDGLFLVPRLGGVGAADAAEDDA